MRFRVTDCLAIAALVVVLGATLAPVVARVQRSVPDTTCQANMRMWARALNVYSQDYEGRYRTNRNWQMFPTLGGITAEVRLSPDEVGADGQPLRFVYGVCWVEALYEYVAASAGRSGRSEAPAAYMRCPNALEAYWPPTQVVGPRMTYALNYNLVENWPALTRMPRKTMMLREMDRRVNSVLRPTNECRTGFQAPRAPFLTPSDFAMGSTELDDKLHGTGSHIAFQDGHVAHFKTAFFPYPDTLFRTNIPQHWDPETWQWYNWVFDSPANDTERMLDRSIAITP